MVWKKGQSGNLKGRPKGKTLKEFAREHLMSLSNKEKLEYLKQLPAEIVWKMGEGNPEQKSDVKVEGQFSLTQIITQAEKPKEIEHEE